MSHKLLMGLRANSKKELNGLSSTCRGKRKREKSRKSRLLNKK
jgi:hypothetical protein